MGDLGGGVSTDCSNIFQKEKDKWIDSCICKESRDLLLAST